MPMTLSGDGTITGLADEATTLDELRAIKVEALNATQA